MGIGQTNPEKLKQFVRNKQEGAEWSRGLWKPKDGKYVFRILPPTEDHDMWFYPYFMHYGIIPDPPEGESGAVTCPKTVNQPCPIDPVVRKLWNGDASERSLAAKIKRVGRYAVNVLVLFENGRPTQAKDRVPKMWPIGEKIFAQLQSIAVQNDGSVVPLDSLDRGHNLNLTVTSEKGQDGKSYPNYIITAALQPSKIVDRTFLKGMKSIVKEVQKNIKPFEVLRAIFSGAEADASNADVPVDEVAAEIPPVEVVASSDDIQAEPENVEEVPAVEEELSAPVEDVPVETEPEPESEPEPKPKKATATASQAATTTKEIKDAPKREAASDVAAQARARLAARFAKK